MSYDALLIVGFGGPEGPDDVVPFLESVTRGRNIPRERLVEVGAHYARFGGVSPINGQLRALKAALERELAPMPVYWGNRNWHPMLAATVEQMKRDGVRRALAFVTSAFGSYSGCRQYREDLERARAAVEGAPEIEKLRNYFDHPGFVDALVARVQEGIAGASPHSGDIGGALRRADRAEDASSAARRGAGSRSAPRDARPMSPVRVLADAVSPGASLVLTAHSIPTSMAAGAPYEAQLRAIAAIVAERTGFASHDLVFQSRSGAPGIPWLEPDVGDHVAALGARGVKEVLLVPIGFTSDHMEVVWDLDVVAKERAEAAGVHLVRAATVGTHPRFVAMVRELVEEKTRGGAKRALTTLGEGRCGETCCPPPRRPGA